MIAAMSSNDRSSGPRIAVPPRPVHDGSSSEVFLEVGFERASAEIERFPDGAASFYDAIFGAAQDRLEAILRERLALSRVAATQTARQLLGRVLHPRFTRALFGLDAPMNDWRSPR
jgi:hypothetical protein